MIIAGTGHRPNKLGGYRKDITDKLEQFATNYLSNRKDITKIISGMALGWDLALAKSAINLQIPFIAAVPFKGQELAWPEESQKRYKEILSKANKVEIVSIGTYSAGKMQIRNRWMVDNADLILALYDGTSGGTANCIKYAESKKIPIENLWQDWVKFV